MFRLRATLYVCRWMSCGVNMTSLREGDDAELQVTDGANATTLVYSVRTIDADAPYYVEFDFGD